MKFDFKKAVLVPWGLMLSTFQTWENIFADKNDKNPFKSFFLPVLLVLISIVFAFKVIYADSKHIQTGFVFAVIASLAYFSTFFLTKYFVKSFLIKLNYKNITDNELVKLISYSFSVVFVLKIITTIIPSLFFLQILNIYTIYIVWEGCRVLFDMDEDERGKLMLIIGLSIMFLPAVLSKIVQLLIPGF